MLGLCYRDTVDILRTILLKSAPMPQSSRTAPLRLSELNDAARARLFVQFAALDRSGIPLLQALPIIIKAAPAVFYTRLKTLAQTAQRGVSLAEGGGNVFGIEFDDQGRLFSGTNGGNKCGCDDGVVRTGTGPHV